MLCSYGKRDRVTSVAEWIHRPMEQNWEIDADEYAHVSFLKCAKPIDRGRIAFSINGAGQADIYKAKDKSTVLITAGLRPVIECFPVAPMLVPTPEGTESDRRPVSSWKRICSFSPACSVSLLAEGGVALSICKACAQLLFLSAQTRGYPRPSSRLQAPLYLTQQV